MAEHRDGHPVDPADVNVPGIPGPWKLAPAGQTTFVDIHVPGAEEIDLAIIVALNILADVLEMPTGPLLWRQDGQCWELARGGKHAFFLPPTIFVTSPYPCFPIPRSTDDHEEAARMACALASTWPSDDED